ncbi:SLC13 family permease [Candidatus Thiodictyon syntrophicum]|jgi:di/tricarboxylate transporter|uniref:SLC13 family permease n=1 Tax=Candidatus Thiodictyon syntrophicum TaxID=1166950 RepID=A0A2K8UB65_9GAMM|nr:SLC13 family permease [Candidatus Thiodictyon syntrophicum]AUB82659.1 SLC13 family permease [Candidatus Thiodictyon syntrophicum]
MNPDLLRVLLLLGAAILMFALNRPRVDAVALIMIVALPFTGVITMNEAIAGFSNPNIVLIGAMFVVGEALARTGVARRVGDRLIVWGGTRAWLLLTLLMVAVGVLGSVMSSTGVVAIFIPVVLRIASRTGIAPSQLMMPMAYAALISGTMTLVATSSNLVINYELTRAGGAGFNFFSFTPFGLPILLLGVLYMLGARRWLTASADAGVQVTRRPSLRHWVERYQLAEREYRVRVKPQSPLLGKALGVQDLRSKIGARIILIERGRGRARRLLSRTPETRLQAGDVLLLDVDTEVTDVPDLCERYAVELLPRTGFYFADQSQEVGLVEVMLPDGAAFVGKTVAEAELLAQSELSLVGVRRGRQAIAPHGVRETQLKVGDTLLLAGPWKVIRGLRSNGQDLVVLNLPKEFDEVLPAARKAPYALFTLGVVIILMATGLVPNVQAALIGGLLMGLFRCIDLDQAYRAIQWKGLIMIVGMLPFALALDRTGGVDLAAQALVGLAGGAGPYAILALLFGLTVVLGLFIVNTANAVLLIPIGLAMADALNASPYPFAMIIALAASCAFMTPISPVNTLVATAGNYSFADFIRIGLPLTLIVMVVSVLLVPWLLPLY